MLTLSDIKQKSVEIIKDSFYFLPNSRCHPNSVRTPLSVQMVNFDKNYVYSAFNNDFGPFHLGQIVRYCREIQSLLQSQKATGLAKRKPPRSKWANGSSDEEDDHSSSKMVLVHQCQTGGKNMSNHIVLVAAFMIICRGYSSKQVSAVFNKLDSTALPFCDAGARPS